MNLKKFEICKSDDLGQSYNRFILVIVLLILLVDKKFVQ